MNDYRPQHVIAWVESIVELAASSRRTVSACTRPGRSPPLQSTFNLTCTSCSRACFAPRSSTSTVRARSRGSAWTAPATKDCTCRSEHLPGGASRRRYAGEPRRGRAHRGDVPDQLLAAADQVRHRRPWGVGRGALQLRTGLAAASRGHGAHLGHLREGRRHAGRRRVLQLIVFLQDWVQQFQVVQEAVDRSRVPSSCVATCRPGRRRRRGLEETPPGRSVWPWVRTAPSRSSSWTRSRRPPRPSTASPISKVHGDSG